MKRTNRQYQVFCILLSASVAWSAVGCGSGGCGRQDRAKDVLRVGIESRPSTLDPRHSTDAAASRIGELIFSRLVKYDRNFEIIPDAAHKWEISKDGLTYRFHLRSGIRFHNGSDLTARDVAFTFNSIRDAKTGSVKRQIYDVIKRIEIESPLTVTFHLKEPYAPFLTDAILGILPEETDEKGIDAARLPVGSGPFRIVANESGGRVTLKRFEDYFGKEAGVAGIDFRYIAEDTLRILELRKGTLDLIQNDLTPELLPGLRSDPNIRVITAPGVNYSYLGMNLRDPILSKLPVRQAIGHAIDRDTILEFVLRDSASKAETILGPGNWAHDPEIRGPAYDPEKARRLLDEAGYPDPDGDGPRKRMNLVYKTSTNKLRLRIAEVIRRNLDAVSIGMRIESYEFPTFFGDIKKGNFQLYSLTWVGISEPNILFAIFHSSAPPPDGYNRVFYANAKVDALLEQARREVDQEQRKKLYRQVQVQLAKDLPYISLWYTNNIACMRSRVKGFQLYPAGNYYTLANVTLED